MRLFVTQSEYADKVVAAVEAENRCTSQMRLLIDQISTQQGKIVALEVKRYQLLSGLLASATKTVLFQKKGSDESRSVDN